MIQVNILRDRNEVVKGIDINGHAGYAEYGQDVICAAVSALVLTWQTPLKHLRTITSKEVWGKMVEAFLFPSRTKLVLSRSSS